MENIELNYDLRKALRLKLADAQAKNPNYSLRSFAKGLGVHASYLSEFFNGKRQLSARTQKKIIGNLNVDPMIKFDLLNSIEKVVAPEQIQMDTDSYYLVSDPLYYSILCLIETKDFVNDTKFIAQRLKRTIKEVKEALKLLERVGYIQSKNGRLLVGNAHITTSDDVANTSLRIRHCENLDHAKAALMHLDISKRYFRFETLAISTKNFKEFKAAADDFFNKLILLSNLSNKKDEVYEFCFNYFPRTEPHKECL